SYPNILTHLDLTQCPSMESFALAGNLSTRRIDVSKAGNPNLQNFIASYNRLTLSQCAALFDASNSPGEAFTTNQFLDPLTFARGDTADLSAEATLTKGGTTKNTVFEVLDYSRNTPADPSVYTVVQNGVFTFHKAGKYFIKMTNELANSGIERTLSVGLAAVYQEVSIYGSTDMNLTDLKVASQAGEKPLTPIFDSLTLNYTVDVDFNESYVIVTATLSDTASTLSGDTGMQMLAEGENTLAVTVTAEGGVAAKTYTILVNRAYGIPAEVNTHLASNVMGNSAVVHGVIIANDDTILSQGFEWRVLYSGDNWTISVAASDTSDISSQLTGLSFYTPYEFRAYAQTPKATRYGAILAFTTTNETIIAETENYASVRINPNPTTGKLKIEFSVVGSPLSVELFDVVGQCVGVYAVRPEDTETVIDISHLANGMYFLKIDGKTVKVVKQ
ncbi:MAG: T9SS type A sorting domain-containing protein, partial [Lentimicrobiaceae bacterium]|nr:T9SS type A sorting domain-containing protein [Lentimicrobiaceae bacterium]